MAAHYRSLHFASRDRELVSRQQYVLIHDIYYGHNGPKLRSFNVNEGHRTMARQAQLVREKGLYNRWTNPHGAAAPSCSAPHIKCGRADHALDLDEVDSFIRAAARRGVRYRKTVSTESWHVEPDPEDLRRYYERNKARVLGHGYRKEIKPGMTGADVRNVQKLLKKHGHLPKNWKPGKYYRKGRTMEKAVNALKHKHGLPRDGIIGPRTLKILRHS